jgi:hypothetical protein
LCRRARRKLNNYFVRQFAFYFVHT